MLVDFGRAVDLETAKLAGSTAGETKIVGEASPREMMCVAMRNKMPWSYDIDTFGVCAAAHVLLFGRHIDIARNGSGRWMPKEQFKKYMKKDIWAEVFDSLLNLDDISMTAIGSHPKCVREIRDRIETHLLSRQDELITALQRQVTVLPQRRSEL